MKLIFVKMHGALNDFVIIDQQNSPILFKKSDFELIAHRQKGIGCDQIILIKSPKQSKSEALIEFINADGSSSSTCGNGLRCAAAYILQKKKISQLSSFFLETPAGIHKVTVQNNQIFVEMPLPQIEQTDIPIKTFNIPELKNHITHSITSLSLGNPHVVFFIKNLLKIPIIEWGKIIQSNPIFPQGINVSFAQIHSSSKIELRVFERGTGLTFACGSGACAAVISGNNQNILDNHCSVSMLGGELSVYFKENEKLLLSGPYVFVYTGTIDYPFL